MASAKEYPSFIDDSKPEPMANPYGKLCIANPMPTIMPVRINELLLADDK